VEDPHFSMFKYPKTPRLSDAEVMDTNHLFWKGKHAVVEEKVDGANAAIYFDDEQQLVLQSRGHVLTGGARERLFERMWPWAYERLDGLREVLGTRYIAFGEWVFAKNRVFYDALPDFFIEFDVLDRHEGVFMTTSARQSLLAASPLTSVAVLWEGRFDKAPAFGSFVGPSRYKTPGWRKHYQAAMDDGLGKHYDPSETDDTILMEGVYIKIEDDHRVVGRLKCPRLEFEKIQTDDVKWGRRPLFPNQLRK